VSHSQTETELLILVTPHLVDAMACNQLPKYVPGQETRIPDDFELFLEGIIEAPRGQREVFHGKKYQAPYLNSPSAAVFPCGLGGSGYGTCGVNGQCGTGTCGTGNCTPVNGAAQKPVVIPTKQPPLAVPTTGPRALPVSHYEESGVHPYGGENFTLPARTGPDAQGGFYEQGAALVPGYSPPVPASFGSMGVVE
jgi:pilus assembly protein CpaC